jgi:hypothetical protein
MPRTPRNPRPPNPERGRSVAPRPPLRSGRSPLDGVDRLIVDGTNMLYRLGTAGAAPPAAIIGRLRAAIPAAVSIELVFDGMGHGVFGRVAQGMHVRYSGRQTADEVILQLASGAAMSGSRGQSRAPTAGVLVVTNDHELRTLLMAAGARTAPLQWLISRLDLPKLAAPASGNRRPSAARGALGATTETDDERPGWKPGRGATAKKGPAHKVARHKRHPRAT